MHPLTKPYATSFLSSRAPDLVLSPSCVPLSYAHPPPHPQCLPLPLTLRPHTCTHQHTYAHILRDIMLPLLSSHSHAPLCLPFHCLHKLTLYSTYACIHTHAHHYTSLQHDSPMLGLSQSSTYSHSLVGPGLLSSSTMSTWSLGRHWLSQAPTSGCMSSWGRSSGV